jgi:peptidoglycan/LPS O-acetylase OafA/YrhL
MNAPEPGDCFRPDIEGLRGVAVLLVVACHCGISWCAGGFVGVDVFFVLSGYLITGLLATEYRATTRIDFARFFARRARRLLPACALVLLVTTLAAAAAFAPQEIAFTARAAGAAGLYVSNVFFDHSAADYFAPNVEGNPLLHTWSLGLEEQFYLIWPLLIMLASRGPNRARRSIWILGALAAVSFLCCVYATQRLPTVAFYELPARAWEFAAGGLLALLPVSMTSVATRGAVAIGIVGIALILGTAVVVKGGAGFPGWIALFPVTGALATIFAGAKASQRGISVVLSAAPLQFVGARSYSWYLWHWPFVVFGGVLFPDISVGGKVAAAIAAFLAAMLSFLLVESPVRVNPYLTARSGLSLGFAAGATVLTVASAWTLMIFGRQQLRMDQKFQSIEAAASDIGDIPRNCWSEGRSFDVKVCEFGAAAALQTLVLFGDSHSMQWVNPMRTAADLEAWRLVTVLRPGCAASDINPHQLSTAADHCKEWRARAIDKIIAMRPSAVVMSSYNGATLRGDFITATLMPVEEIRLGTRRTLQKLSRAGVPVVVLRDTPLPPFNIPACVVRREAARLLGGESCDFSASSALNEAAYAAERAAADGLTDVYFLDMNDLICPGRSCPATQHDLLIYRDDNHLAGTFAESLAPAVRTRLFQLLRNTQSADRSQMGAPGSSSTLAASRID